MGKKLWANAIPNAKRSAVTFYLCHPCNPWFIFRVPGPGCFPPPLRHDRDGQRHKGVP
jgi:hypothetical protein